MGARIKSKADDVHEQCLPYLRYTCANGNELRGLKVGKRVDGQAAHFRGDKGY